MTNDAYSTHKMEEMDLQVKILKLRNKIELAQKQLTTIQVQNAAN